MDSWGDVLCALQKQDLPLRIQVTVGHHRPNTPICLSIPLLGYHIPEHTEYYGSVLLLPGWQSLTEGWKWRSNHGDPVSDGGWWMTQRRKGRYWEMWKESTHTLLSERVSVSVTGWLRTSAASEHSVIQLWHLVPVCVRMCVCAAVWLGTARSSAHSRAEASRRRRTDSHSPPLLGTSKEDCVPTADNL